MSQGFEGMFLFHDHLDIRVEDRTTKQVYKPMNVLYMYSAFIILINMGLLKDTGCLDKCTLWLSLICKLQIAYIHTNTCIHILEPIVAHQSNSLPPPVLKMDTFDLISHKFTCNRSYLL